MVEQDTDKLIEESMALVMEKAKEVKECRRLTEEGNSSGCMDDREVDSLLDESGQPVPVPEKLSNVLLINEKDLGVQMPGGALLKMVVLVEHAPEDESLEHPDAFKELYEVNNEAHKRAGVVPGVHMDNHHNEYKPEQIFDMVEKVLDDPDNSDLPGCGYAGMLVIDSNPLAINERSQRFFKNNKAVPRMVKLGSKLAELAGHHANQQSGEAFAVMNMAPNTTLDHSELKKRGLKVYNYDVVKSDEITNNIVDILREKGKDSWADIIKDQGIPMEREHYRRASLALAGMEPVVID